MRTRTRTPNGIGQKFRCMSRHESSIVTGRIGVAGAAASNATVPRRLKGFSSPRRARVPSGKITAETPLRLDTPAELADLDHGLLRVVTVDQAVAAAPEVVRDARNEARQLALRHELRKVREQEVQQQRDVEHALVVGDDEVGVSAA